MKRLVFLTACGSLTVALPLAFAICAFPGSSKAAPDPETLATVDGTLVTTRDLDALLASQKRPEPGTAAPPSLTTDGVLKRLIQNRLLEQEGYRIGADKEPEVADQVWDFKVRRGMMALLDSVSAGVALPDSAKFEAVLAQSNTMWRVAHIRVGKESQARALLDSLKSGSVFGDLARRHSTDTTSAARDGDLGWARQDLYIPEFRAALDGIAKGAVAGPVKTDDGWHVLKLTDTRTETIGQSEEMRVQLRDAAMRDHVMKKVSGYVDSLRDKYGVVVRDSLLASLDYGSADAAVQSRLRSSTEVLATLPWRTVSVSELTRRIRFQHFHGVEGKPEAARIRDKIFDEWLTELLLRHEAVVLGFDKKPEIVAAAGELERSLLRESVGKKLLDVPFDPKPAEVERYWKGHLAEFTPPARVMADGVLLKDEAAAKRFRQQLEAGAKLRWLADRTSEVQDAKPPVFADWVEPKNLGLVPSQLVPGGIVGPLPMQGAWAVASITKIETPQPMPLDRCRDSVITAMKGERTREIMTRAVTRLESAAKIKVADGAHATVSARVDAWLGRPAATSGGASAATNAPSEGGP